MSESGFKKLYARFRILGANCLAHGSKGMKRLYRSNPNKEQIVKLYKDEYFDCNYRHACELMLERNGLNANRESLRRWLIEDGYIKIKPVKPQHRARREPKEYFGELLQMDGTFDNWFCGVKTCAINITDDATKIGMLHFAEQETIESACLCVWRWIKTYGVPKAFYVDGRNMYQMLEKREHNFFTNMCEVLNIEVILAGSAQAKGRVERSNGVHQDRLMPLFRLEGINSIEGANEYVERVYERKHNAKFSRLPKSGDGHRALPEWVKEIEYVCWLEAERVLQNDWTVSYKKRLFQIDRQSVYVPAKKHIKLRETIKGSIEIIYRGHPIKWHEIL
jgi:hypothetical protein